MSRNYHQRCPVAAALDAIGDRWTLLVLRELAIGPRRFTDLRAALPGLAPNLLTSRLRDLEERALAARQELPPPASRTVYVLTERGRDVLPVLAALARFGMPLVPTDAPEPMRPGVALYGALMPWFCRGGRETPLKVRLDLDGQSFHLRIADGRCTVGDVAPPDVVVSCDSETLVSIRQGQLGYDDAVALGAVELYGDAADVAAFEHHFRLGPSPDPDRAKGNRHVHPGGQR